MKAAEERRAAWPHGRTVAAERTDRVALYDVVTGQRVAELAVGAQVFAFSRDHKRLAFGSGDARHAFRRDGEVTAAETGRPPQNALSARNSTLPWTQGKHPLLGLR